MSEQKSKMKELAKRVKKSQKERKSKGGYDDANLKIAERRLVMIKSHTLLNL